MRAHRVMSWIRSQVVAACAMLCALGTASAAHAQEVIEYYGTDNLGSIRVVFNATGTIVSRADYLPFGEELAAPGPMPAERFTGQARDGEAGMDYVHARQYQPRSGRFNAVDPVYAGLFDPQQWNRYSYARNNPLSLIDPSGMLAQGPTIPNFCSAEFDFNKCGGQDLFWDTGGGGGGFQFGGDYALAQERGYVPGMPADMWAGLDSFNQSVDDTIIANYLANADTETLVGTSASWPRLAQLAGQAITRLTPVAQRGLDALLRLVGSGSTAAAIERIVRSTGSQSQAAAALNSLGVSQQQAIDALTRVTMNSGRVVAWVVESGADRILIGKFHGANQPIIHVAANDIATMGKATVSWSESAGYAVTNIVFR